MRPFAPVNAANLKAVLDRDLAQALHSGLLAPGSGAGVSIGVSEHGVRRVFSYGAARPDSLFEIGSITKTFTGLILAQMIARGKARLDEPVRELLPTGLVSKPAGREMTLLDLATHHSGLPRMPSNFHPADRTRPFADYHAEQLYEFLRIYPWGMSNPTPTRFLYSNLGFGLLGQALALRAGTEYPALLQQQVIGPLGLHDTVVTLSAEQHGRFIQGHDADLHPVPAWDLDGLAGAGAIRSTAGDILTYLEAQLHPERWRGAGTLGEALAFSHVLRADAGNGARIALAWMYNTADENYEHGGATGGFSSHAFFDPKRDYAAIVLLNTAANNGFADVLGIHIRQRLAGQPAQSLTYVTIPPGGGVVNFVRVFAAYWVVMLAAGAFIFCCVLGLQGLTAQLLPRQLFLRLSPFLQMGALCLFVCVYILQLMAAGSNELLAAMSGGALAWSPGFWFLGLFQQLSASPAMPVLARRAWIGLAAAVSVTAVAYLLSYLRTLPQIVEEPDILPVAPRGLVAGVRRFAVSRGDAVQRPHFTAQPAAPHDSHLLLGNRVRRHDLLPESPAGGRGGSLQRPGQRAPSGGQHHDVGLPGGGYACGVCAAPRTGRQLDLPRGPDSRRPAPSGGAAASVSAAVHRAGHPVCGGPVSFHLAVAAGGRTHSGAGSARPLAWGNLPDGLPEDSLRLFLPAWQIQFSPHLLVLRGVDHQAGGYGSARRALRAGSPRHLRRTAGRPGGGCRLSPMAERTACGFGYRASV